MLCYVLQSVRVVTRACAGVPGKPRAYSLNCNVSATSRHVFYVLRPTDPTRPTHILGANMPTATTSRDKSEEPRSEKCTTITLHSRRIARIQVARFLRGNLRAAVLLAPVPAPLPLPIATHPQSTAIAQAAHSAGQQKIGEKP